MKKKVYLFIFGFFAGILNGLLGAGGGMIMVPLLEKNGLKKKEAHATSIFTIFPLAIISSIFYLARGDVHFSDTLIFLPFGIIGAIIGAKFMKNINAIYLRIIFTLLLFYSSIRMLLQ